MPDYKLIGHDYTPPDLVAKVTGRAKFSEDIRAEGMLYCRVLRSPLPHARVRGIDSAEALKMPGVKAILTPADLPRYLGTAPGPSMTPQPALASEPLFEGEPVLAVAATDEAAAVAAIEAIKVDFEPLPFVIDPLETLRPGGPNPRLQGNVLLGGQISDVKWTDADFAELKAGRMPMGQVPASEHWVMGDLEGGFRQAATVVDESFVIESTPHVPLEARSALAYWQNGRLFVYTGTQSLAQTWPVVAQYAEVNATDLVFISEYTGGAFGGKIAGHHFVIIPILLAKKTGQPVMMRVTRDDEMAIGPTRSGMIGRARAGFAKNGRLTALDLFLIGDGASYAFSDHLSSAHLASLLYQPQAMRFRGITVLTNTPAHGSQRGPGMQVVPVVEQVISKAARQLGLDQLAIRRVNAPSGKAPVGPGARDGSRRTVSMANVPQALDRGAELFGWAERKARSGKREGSKVRGIGVAVGTYTAGVAGYDGLVIIKPDGKLYVHSGAGNLGTNSTYDTCRAAAEALDMPWDKVVIVQGDSSKFVPWSCSQSGSSTTFAHTRANWVAGLDARRKLQEIAAQDLGGSPDEYVVERERVFRKSAPATGLTFGQAAARAIALAGRFDGHEVSTDLNGMTRWAAAHLTGLGLMGVARDALPRGEGDLFSFVAGFAEVEVDVETGEMRVTDYVAVADCGTVLHPRNCRGQVHGGSMLGLAHGLYHKDVFDRRQGVSLSRRFYHYKPITILDAPAFQFAALNIPDPQTPIGARGIGEPPGPAAYGAVINALIDAVGEEAFRRAPVTPDRILAALEAGGRRPQDSLAVHI
jgi:xanthine dehydrogenase molybdenum-binding subunit